MILDYAGETNIGRVRGKNEDSYLIGPTPKGVVLLVADGLGGHPGGEVASRLAVDTIFSFLQREASLEGAINQANITVYLTPPSGMGTTIVGACVEDDKITIGHLGDSRAYLLRDGVLYLLTQDHTPAGMSGDTTHSNMLLKAVGLVKSTEPSIVRHAMRSGDWYVLCSDGLYTELTSDDMVRILSAAVSSRSAVDAMIDLAVENGGRDNVTAICLRVR